MIRSSPFHGPRHALVHVGPVTCRSRSMPSERSLVIRSRRADEPLGPAKSLNLAIPKRARYFRDTERNQDRVGDCRGAARNEARAPPSRMGACTRPAP